MEIAPCINVANSKNCILFNRLKAGIRINEFVFTMLDMLGVIGT